MNVLKKFGAVFALCILASCSGGKGITEPPTPPTLALSITGTSADADSAVVSLSVRPTDAQVNVTFGEGTACSAATQAATKRSSDEWVLRPLRRGEVEYAVKATASAGGKTVEDCTTLTSFRHVDPCVDPQEEWEMTTVEFRYLPPEQAPLSRSIEPVHFILVCDDRYEFLPLSTDLIISTDEGKTFDYTYQDEIPARARGGVAAGEFDDVLRHIRWLEGSEIELRLHLSGGTTAWMNPTRKADFTIPHRCGEGNGCTDTTPWLFEIAQAEGGSLFLRP